LIHSLIRLGVAIREEARMNIRYHVELSEAERGELAALVGGGNRSTRFELLPMRLLYLVRFPIPNDRGRESWSPIGRLFHRFG
jgi:hypothetical protein